VSQTPPSGRGDTLAAIVVLYESEAVVERCLESLRRAAPRRGLELRVVDNASRDAGAALAERIAGAGSVIRMTSNRGFAAGVNAGLAATGARFRAVLNPDTEVPPGALDALADVLEEHPRAALVGPAVHDESGVPERSCGRFPTLARERAHAWMLDRLLGLEGRAAPFPRETAPVDWVSGCAWMLRAGALEAIGPLDEGYFMYCEDVDWCRRARDAGWDVLATPRVRVRHTLSRGSSGTSSLPADGGTSMLRYFGKFHPEVAPERIRDVLASGWRLRRAWQRLRAGLGDARAAGAARRYERALEAAGCR
jgi:GT2 family glycosyltransferase